MKSQINTLRQLQELVLTRDEHNQTGDGSHLDALNDSIAALQQKLAPQMDREKIIVITISGRGDKDCAAIARYRGEDLHE